MQWLVDLFRDRQDSLVRLVYDRAESSRYTRYAAQGIEAWQQSVTGLRDAFVNALLSSATSRSWGPDDDLDPDNAIVGFGIREARKHRARGISLPLFLGLFKHYRHAWHELVVEAKVGDEAARPAHQAIDAFFDSVELGVCADWAEQSFPGLLQEVQEANRSLVRQLARWRTLFDGLGEPVFLLDSAGRLQSLNRAAFESFIGVGPAGLDRCGLALVDAIPSVGAVVQEMLAIPGTEALSQRILPTTNGPREFDIRVRRVKSIGGTPMGTLVVLRDETDRVMAERESATSRRHLDDALEATSDAVFTVDAEWRLTYVNRRATELLRHSRDEMIGVCMWELFPEAVGTPFQSNYQRAVTDRVPVSFEEFYPPFNTWFECSAHPQDGGLTVFFRDCTARRSAEEALRLSEERYALAVKGANDGLWDINLVEGTGFYSARCLAILGHEAADLNDRADLWRGLVHPEDRSVVEDALAAHLADTAPSVEVECRIRHRDGSWVWVRMRGLAVRDSAGRVVRIVGSLSDITARKQFEEQLEFQALHDALTGLPNRALFLDRLNQGIAVARRRSWFHYAVLFMDLDRFKIVNDSLGHTAGDQLLHSVSRRIAECLRPGDTVARVGGDEFAVLLNDLRDVSDASVVAQRILAHVAQPVLVGGQEFLPNISIGIAHSGVEYERAEDVLRDADTAMYRAKSLGRGRTVVFDCAMHDEVAQRLSVEAELRRAVEQKEFVVFYQPIVSLADGHLSGFEALVRWNDPHRGIRSPADFIHIAEETGLIVPIGEFVLREACRQAAAWAGTLPVGRRPTISVNFSVRQFASGVALEEVRAALASSGLDARSLKVEITESILMEDTRDVHEQLKALASLGVQLQMDDFGTGYSSLAYLHRFPIDAIKVDRSFVSQVHAVVRGEVVRTIVLLARSLDMATIAEGVETVEQLSRLRGLQCDFAQGFLFSRPVDAAAATRLLDDGIGWGDLLPVSTEG